MCAREYNITFIGAEVTDWRKRANDALEDRIKVKHNMNVAKNVIFFIGDGMDITTITASRIYKGQKNGKIGELESLNFENLPFVGLSKVRVDAPVIPLN